VGAFVTELMLCRPRRLPDHLAEQAARTAALINPLNHARTQDHAFSPPFHPVVPT